ncbi:MAG: 30S ribosomal protein S12 methylthiotransferase RimO [Anaerolineae bacterium]|nr:30S ribosomal protein S12 methylthiotransferase RimO [Anaerolineae bacterium]
MRFYLLTLGCPKNVVDSEAMSELLRSQGHVPVSTPAAADLLIVNTCGFLAAAREEALDELRQLAARKRRGQLLVAAGCLAQRDGREILRQVPAVDGLLGTRRWMEIGTLLQQLTARGREQAPALLGDPALDPPAVSPRSPATSGWAYLKISEGCDAPCAFCTIPAIKGPLRSRPLQALVAEARALAASGAQEIILIGQDTTAYGRDLGLRDGLPHLVQAILAALPELRWLRLMYAYPGHVSERLIEVMATDDRVCHYLDLPLQHGHADTLRRMRRPADVEQMLRLIERLRAAMPDIALRSTFIVGYPGETADEFQTLLEFVETVQLDKVGVFTFSAEPGTAAAKLPDQVPEEVKRERYERLMAVQQRISLARNQAQVGRRLEVLVEGMGDGLSVGRSYRDAPEIDGLVLVAGTLPLARLTPVLITGAMEYDLVGEVWRGVT